MAIPTADDIADRSKSDAFTKAFALVQSGWLILSSIARVYHGYSITELELATMAFIVCALAMYFFWWNKPFGIEQRLVMVRVTGDPSPYSRPRYTEYQRIDDLSWKQFVDLMIRNDLMEDGNITENYPTLALYLSGMAFSAVHVAAWNWTFPSRLIQILWRTSTVAAFGASFLPLACVFLGICYRWVSQDWLESAIAYLFFGIGYGGVGIYVVARLVILFLTFYCFTAMPASAYEKVDWTGYIPHFS